MQNRHTKLKTTIDPHFFTDNLEICQEPTYHNLEVTFGKYFYKFNFLLPFKKKTQNRSERNTAIINATT